MCKNSKSKLSKQINRQFLQKSKQINWRFSQKSKQINRQFSQKSKQIINVGPIKPDN